MGDRTRSTSSRPIRSTGMSPRTGKAWRSNCCSQLAAVFSLRHRGRLASQVLTTAWRSVSACALRCSASGSRPSAIATRLANARWRAFASGTSVALPSPMSRRLPLMTTRCTQLFEPPGAMLRNRVSPSPYLPGFRESLGMWGEGVECRGWGSNPHGPHGPRDFKSRVSTSSTTSASAARRSPVRLEWYRHATGDRQRSASLARLRAGVPVRAEACEARDTAADRGSARLDAAGAGCRPPS